MRHRASLATIFRNNALRNGLPTVALEQQELDELVAWVNADPITIPLSWISRLARLSPIPIGTRKFSQSTLPRGRCSGGVDEIGLTEQSIDLVARFEGQDQARRPWVYLASD